MSNKGIIIQGSARSDGNTNKIVTYIVDKTGFEFIDLRKKDIGYFDYDFKNSDDDFIPIMREFTDQYDTLIFATPIYWYSMSGIMKTFFDRITDLLRKEKELGRRLRGKNMAMISCGSGSYQPDFFPKPFSETAKYLGMNYLGDVHSWIENEEIPAEVLEKLKKLIAKVK